MATALDTEELRRFREQWRREVLREKETAEEKATQIITDALSNTLTYNNILNEDKLEDRGSQELDQLTLQIISSQEAQNEIENTIENNNTQICYISALPVEILMKIMQGFDAKTLETCSTVCRNWFIVSRCGILWKDICFKEYPSCKGFKALYSNNWRTMYIKRPRLRYDGIYISKFEYVRPGLTEGTYVNPVHRVVYFRYLRFYPEGKLLSYLGSEKPKDISEWFKSENRHKLDKFDCGFFSKEEELIDIWSKNKHKVMFNIKIELYSTTPGKNDRLLCKDYHSFKENGEGRYDYCMKIPPYQFVKLPPHLL